MITISPRRALLLALAAGVSVAGGVAPPASAEPVWTLADHPAPPEGSQFKVPLGAPGDLQFFAPNRGLLAVEGNASIPRGLFSWNGERWRQLSTVCGGPGDTTRIAWAGPREFWTVTEPSLPRTGSGLALCRFKDGQVVGSFSTPERAFDPYRRMNSAVCDGPSNCWFAGVGSADPGGEREGSFHLRWDGTGLRTYYNPQGRGVSDLETIGGRFFESTFVGPSSEGRDTPSRLRAPEDRPRLLHRGDAGVFVNDPFVVRDVPDPDQGDGQSAPDDATDLLALDADGTDLWAVGGGTLSGAAAPDDPDTAADESAGPYPRGPIAVRLDGTGFTELALSRAFAPDERFVDVAAVPGSDRAWVAVQRYSERRTPSARGRVALLGADGTVEAVTTLPTSGAGRGAIAKVAFTGPNDGWAVTSAGWIFHFTDGARPPRDDDPAFAELIDFRPNEAAAQFVPDTPPIDDASLLAPPELEIEQQPAAAEQKAQVRRLPALIANVRSRLRGRRTLVISFALRRRARIGVVGRRRGKVVARLRARTLLPGRRRTIRVRLNPRRYPTRVSFSIRELDLPAGTAPGADDTGAGAGDTVTTGGGGEAPATGGGAGETVTTGS